MDYNLQDLRKELDELDKEWIALLAKRFAVTEKVGQYKKAHDLPPVDITREEAQFERISELARQHGLDEVFAKNVLRLIIDLVVIKHTQIKNS